MTPTGRIGEPPPTTLDGDALVWCDGAFNTPNGKTAHGLVRYTRRYRVVGVVDHRHAGQDAGVVLDGKPAGIPVYADVDAAIDAAPEARTLVVGIAPDGGRLTANDRAAVKTALARGLGVDCGLHDYLSDDAELVALAARTGARIRDIRKPKHTRDLHFFTGRINEVGSLKVAVLGTDSAVGKRTTAVLIVQGMRARGLSAEMIATGQTGWMQGARYALVLDSLIADFMAGELEHAVVRAWDEVRPDVVVVEGQGSLMNPAYPGGFEILAATRPDAIVMQHAPARDEYDGFPGYPMHPLATQIQAVELVSGRQVVAVTLNHEGMSRAAVDAACAQIEAELGLPCEDPLWHGLDRVLDALIARRPAPPGPA